MAMQVNTALCVVGMVVIGFWQGCFFPRSTPLTDVYRDTGTSGLYFHNYRRFYYFFHHLGLFPVAATVEPTVDTREGAERFVQEHGPQLVNEISHTVRSGERGKFLLFAFDAWVRGSALDAGTRPFQACAFILALMALWGGFVWVGQPLLGALTVLFLGSNPFQLWEVYRSSNLFGWPGTVGILLMALSLPLLYRRVGFRYTLFYIATAALVLGTVRLIRPEPTAMAVSVLGCLFFFSPGGRFQRLAACVGFISLFLLIVSGWNAYLDAKTRSAVEWVNSKGGYPYPAFHYASHRFWHPMYLGLGDFDRKYGHVWDDRQAYELAAEILGEKSDAFPFTPGSFVLNRTHDEKGHYSVKFEDVPEYNALMKHLFLSRVMSDPLWYLEILAKRVWRLIEETTPLSVQWGGHRFGISWPGWYCFLVIVLAVRRRRWTEVGLLVFLMPIGATALLVYSGDGRSFYSLYHLLAASVALAWWGESTHVRDIWRKFYAWNPAR